MMLVHAQPVCWWPAKFDAHEGPVVIGVDGGAADLGARRAAAEAGYDGEAAPVVIGGGGGVAPLKTPETRLRAYGGERVDARARVREALRAAVGQLTGVAPGAITIQSRPGSAPSVSYAGGDGATPGISISHDEPLSLAAINLRGPVGVDLMRVQAIPDWRAVAGDYLGPHIATQLDATPESHRAATFARAWSTHEARLKCHGLQLTEWSPRLAAQLDGCHCRALALPEGFAGAVAWRD